MATIEFINKRIEGKEKEIDKLTKKIERIRKAEATNWEVNPYYYCESDLKWALRDLEAAEKALTEYKEQLAVATEKANSRNVPAILEFLEMWKARCTKYYSAGLKAYFEESKMVYELSREVHNYRYGTEEYKAAEEKFEAASKEFRQKRIGYYEERTYTDWRGYERKTEVKVADGEYEAYRPYTSECSYEEAMAKVAKDLNIEADRKYDFIIERTNAIVGTITDASMLKVGAKGDLNGFILGEKGKAKVNTIGAGGYNIQCYHFRTLIHAA